MTGEEERYSHTDLWAFQANVEGAKKAYDVVAPVVATKDPALKAKLDTAFAELQTELDLYKVGDGYVLYTDLTDAQVKALGGEGRGPVRAPLRAHGHRGVVTQPTVSRRRVLGFAAGGAALGVAGVGAAAVLTDQAASASSKAEAASPSREPTRPASRRPSRTGCTSRPST